MEYTILIKRTPQGFSAWVPGLPGCWSEGDSEAEALDNIKDALSDYLHVARNIATRAPNVTAHSVTINVA